MQDSVALMVHVVNTIASILGAPSLAEKELVGLALSGLYNRMLEASEGLAKDSDNGVSWCFAGGYFHLIAEYEDGKSVFKIHPGTQAIEVELYAQLENKPIGVFGRLLHASWALDFGYIMHAAVSPIKFERNAAERQRQLLAKIVESTPSMRKALESPETDETTINVFLNPRLALKMAC